MTETAGRPDEDPAEPGTPANDLLDAEAGTGPTSDTAPVPGTGPTPEAAPAPGTGPTSQAAPAPGTASSRRTRRPRKAGEAVDPAGPMAGLPPGRPEALRLARLHLRMGQLPLARAQLEALAGRGDLDAEALVDLAEARWRTGDLAGAGDAAATVLAQGRDDPLALLIAAESIAALGRPGEARRLARRAVAVAEGPLDATFAGMPRNAIWPEDREPAGDDGAMPADGIEPGHGTHPGHLAHLRHAIPAGDQEGPATAAAAEAFAGGRAALAGGDVGLAALRLGVALRMDAGFADGVLDAVGDWDRDPALALVAGDALRLLGREAEALAAFDVARGTS